MSKYRNVKVNYNGMRFDSMKEYTRWRELELMQRAGEISELKRQVPYELIPAQYDHRTGKLLERPVKYIADFVYLDEGFRVVEDTKGVRTKEYIMKRKMMLYFHGIRIKEI